MVIKDALKVLIRPPFLKIGSLILNFNLIFPLRTLILILNSQFFPRIVFLDSQKIPLEVSFAILTLGKLTLAEVWPKQLLNQSWVRFSVTEKFFWLTPPPLNSQGLEVLLAHWKLHDNSFWSLVNRLK